MNQNINYIGMVNLLRHLQNAGLVSRKEAGRIAARLRTETCFSRLPGPIFGRTAEQHSSCRDKRLFLFLLRNISTSFAFCKGNHYSPHSDGLILNYAGENTSKNARNRTRQSPTRPPPWPAGVLRRIPYAKSAGGTDSGKR